MNMKTWPALLLTAIACLLPSANAGADPILGQVDDFEDGTTMGWRINLLGMGNPPPETLPVNVPDGGPAGAGDNFLRLTSNGVLGAGGRLVALNLDSRWTGDYVAAGVNAITLQVNNLGATDLALRLLFEHAPAGPPTDLALSTDPVLVPAGGGWVPVTFPIGPDDLTAALGSVDAALTGANVLRLFHSPTPEFPGPPATAVLGVDNITAAFVPAQVVPEPGALVLFAASLVGWDVAARRRGGKVTTGASS
jgi:hypothetical protein